MRSGSAAVCDSCWRANGDALRRAQRRRTSWCPAARDFVGPNGDVTSSRPTATLLRRAERRRHMAQAKTRVDLRVPHTRAHRLDRAVMIRIDERRRTRDEVERVEAHLRELVVHALDRFVDTRVADRRELRL